MKFTKMQGIGNNYIYFDCFEENITEEMMPEISRRVADKNFGIGADGAIFICPYDEEGVDAEMRMYNADGSYGGMCGNGIRCVAKYMYDHALVDSTELCIVSDGAKKYLKLTVEKEVPGKGAEGLSGTAGSFGYNTGKTYSKRSDGNVVSFVRVDMGEAYFAPDMIPAKIPESALTDIVTPAGKKDRAAVMCPVNVNGEEVKITCVNVGNPHAVIFMDTDVKELDLDKIGPYYENHEIFPKRVNTEFVRVIDRKHVEMRVYERGSGETLACGTGGTAVTAACIINGFTDNEITVHLLGGDLKYEWDANTNHMIMTGPAEYICEGVI